MSRLDVGSHPARRAVLAILLLALVMVAAAFVARPLLTGPDRAPLSSAAAPATPVDLPAETMQTSTLVAQQEALPIETYEIFLVRDPFSPVRPDEPTTGGDTTGTTTGDTTGTTTGDTTGTTTGDTTTGDTTGTTGDTTGEPTDGCTQQGEVICDGRVVSLVDVFVDDSGQAVARVQVDNELFDVTDGAVFATNFEVLGIDPPCVTLLFGDDAFTLCEGDRVLK